MTPINKRTRQQGSRLARLIVLGLMMMLPAGLVGCGGYTTAGLFPEDVHSISVPIFENRTLYTGLERTLTDAVIKEIQVRSPYFVTGSSQADTVLSGTIREVTKQKLSEKRGSGLVQEVIQSITVDFEWKDLRSGRVIVQRKDFTAAELYIASEPVGETPEFGRIAAASELARDIVSTMRDQW